MSPSRTRETASLLVAVVVAVAAVTAGTAVWTDTAGARAEGVNLDTSEIEAGDAFTVSYFDDGADGGTTIHVVVDVDGDGEYDADDRTATTASKDGKADSLTFSDTADLDGNYTVYVYEGPSSLSSGTDLTNAGSATVSIDGEPPWVSQFDLTNSSGEELTVTMTTDERLQTREVTLSGPESTTLSGTDFSETDNGDTYTYEATYAVGTDGDYTAELRAATDEFGHDAADNQTLTDTVTVDTTPPTLDATETAVGAQTVEVRFSEAVTDSSGNALAAGDFAYADANGQGATGVTSVAHTAGSDTAVLTLDAAVAPTDLGNDTVAPRADAILDADDNPAGTATTALADTETPAKPQSATSRPVNESNVEEYDLAVSLRDDHEAGTLAVRVSDGSATVEATTAVANRTDGDSDPHDVSFPGLNLSTLADGQLSVEATLTDYGGNARTATVATPTKDTDAPTVANATITNAPIGTYDVGSEQTVTVEFAEEMDTSDAPSVTITGLARSYDVTGGEFVNDTAWAGSVTIVDDDEETEAAIRVADATDAEGNALVTDATNTFEVNTTGPAKPEATTAGNVTASNATDYDVTVELVSGTDADEVKVRASDGTDSVVETASVGPSQTTVTVSGIDVSSLDDGQITVESAALDDGYRNVEGFVEPTTVEKDTAPPTVADVTLAEGRVTDSTAGSPQQVTVEFAEEMNSSDAPTVTLSGLSQSYAVTGSFDDRQTWTGTVTVADDEEEATATVSVADATDPVGNSITANSHDFPVDTDAPVVTNFTVTNPSDRRVRVAFESDQSLASVGVTLDTPGGSVALDRTDFTESGTGPYSYEATYDGTGDGTYEATLDTAADGAGNDGATGQRDATTVDETGPTFSAASPAGTTVADDRKNVSVGVSDTIHGVDATSLELTVEDSSGRLLDAVGTGAAGVTFSGGTLALDTDAAGLAFADGEVTVTVAATDSVGNPAETTFSFDVDTAAPTFGSGSPGGTVADAQATVEVPVSDATAVSPSSVAVTVEDSSGTLLDAAGTGASGVTFSEGTVAFDPAAAGVTLSDGEVNVTVAAADTLGNRANATSSFAVDTPPTIRNFDATATGDGVDISFVSTDQLSTVRVTATGPNGTETVETGAFDGSSAGDDYEYAATFDPGPDGEYSFSLDAATDPQGDGATGQTATAAVDRADPEPASAWIRGADGTETTLTVSFSEPVDASALATDDVSVEGESVTGVADTGSATTRVNVTVSGNVSTGDAPNVSFDAGSYTEAVGDGSGGTDAGTAIHTLRLSLSPGRNYVSIPAVEDDVSLAELDLSGVETVWTYDDNAWRSYDPDAPANDFSALVGGKGYVFVATEETAIDVTVDNVAAGTPRSERLEAGWNLAGHWEEGERAADAALGDVTDAAIAVEARQSATGQFQQVLLGSATFEPGEAYWVYVSENTTYNTTKY
ncbi:beta strand repeat-containing protein [Halorussus salinus]|uniref:beta strand repeat-containing protein n=1 Tax=Halorussus salinus TaxID=1364935 RepID=UPI001091B165|nr:hypothetical protein [Halorussus salinus]